MASVVWYCYGNRPSYLSPVALVGNRRTGPSPFGVSIPNIDGRFSRFGDFPIPVNEIGRHFCGTLSQTISFAYKYVTPVDNVSSNNG